MNFSRVRWNISTATLLDIIRGSLITWIWPTTVQSYIVHRSFTYSNSIEIVSHPIKRIYTSVTLTRRPFLTTVAYFSQPSIIMHEYDFPLIIITKFLSAILISKVSSPLPVRDIIICFVGTKKSQISSREHHISLSNHYIIITTRVKKYIFNHNMT